MESKKNLLPGKVEGLSKTVSAPLPTVNFPTNFENEEYTLPRGMHFYCDSRNILATLSQFIKELLPGDTRMSC
jgi:hypothetical protein